MGKEIISWNQPLDDPTAAEIDVTGSLGNDQRHIVCMDFGMKWNIPRHFICAAIESRSSPGDTSADDIRRLEPDGVFLSNGPGDPEPVHYACETIGQLLGQMPIFGICLGHQLLSLACGAKTFKLKFGHRGVNQPVLDLETNKVEITTQNHGFAVADDGLPDALEVTHRNLNDDTIAGVRHREHSAFAVQYHPEAASGPHDSHYLFARFQTQLGMVPRERAAVNHRYGEWENRSHRDAAAIFLGIAAASFFNRDTRGDIFGQQQCAIHVDIVQQWQQLRDCRHADCRFGHASDHDFQSELTRAINHSPRSVSSHHTSST